MFPQLTAQLPSVMKMYTLVEGDYQAIDLLHYLNFNCIFFRFVHYIFIASMIKQSIYIYIAPFEREHHKHFRQTKQKLN